ncbi:hypothetical protein DFJ58DRAFT_805618 [Suillus subalutaceus]|uniref:uncharacterized protein n=1 Tax=Suillus subalutaceus TaxID=48586 RepID=UPI001B8781D4|nr:uncharacterized protein DFJ58DRAFT_805618 [Suillus subalutaceus]KAG1842733.1 hypothetical protein DFJ58DRAFT_805618 [Suillus subalutaceus]
MVASKILFLFQSAYAHSEHMTDTIERPLPEEQVLIHHRGDVCWSGNAQYKFAVIRMKGRYRVTIYRPFTLVQCDRTYGEYQNRGVLRNGSITSS